VKAGSSRIFLNLFVYRTAFDLLVLLAASSVTLTIALATVSYQVLKTSRVNPAECLRYE